MKVFQTCLLLLIVAIPCAADGYDITVAGSPQRTIVRFDDQPIITAVWNHDDVPRPFFYEAHTQKGTSVLRPFPPDPVRNKDNDDHATYHPGIGLAFGDINGVDFWRNKGQVEAVPDGHTGSQGFNDFDQYIFGAEYIFRDPDNDDAIVCRADVQHRLIPQESGNFLLMRFIFHAEDAPIVFGDQEEMGLGVRIDTPYTVKFGNGSIRNSEGGENEAGTWGKQAKWCALIGKEGGAEVGVNIMPSPENFRPSWFHARDYGLLVANPFGKKAMTAPRDNNVPPDRTVVEKGETFTIEFAVHIFETENGETYDGDSAYKRYIELRNRGDWTVQN